MEILFNFLFISKIQTLSILNAFIDNFDIITRWKIIQPRYLECLNGSATLSGIPQINIHMYEVEMETGAE